MTKKKKKRLQNGLIQKLTHQSLRRERERERVTYLYEVCTQAYSKVKYTDGVRERQGGTEGEKYDGNLFIVKFDFKVHVI